MSKKIRPLLDLQDDPYTDYVLMAVGIGASLIALIYLVLV